MINNTKFNRDTVSNTTNIQPLIVTNKENQKMRFSTSGLEFEGNYYSPLILSLPTIKESIDIENRKYKISSSSITLSNLEYKGEILSNKYSNLLNASIDIYFKTQSCATLNDCLQVYTGKIARITYDYNKITFSIEDLSQQKIHKNIPKKV